MPDKQYIKDEKKIKEMERKLTQIYSRADKELGAEWKAYMDKGQKRCAELKKAVEDAKTPEEKAKAREAFNGYMYQYTLQNDRYRDLTEQYAKQLSKVNETAVKYINGELPGIYSENYNQMGVSMIDSIPLGMSFSAIDENTVRHLIVDDETLLPYKKIDTRKDVRWNTEKVNSEVLQGILQGESIDKIKKRLYNVTEMNKNSAYRNARTSVTSAENKGRIDMMKRAEDSGVISHKVWMSAHDGHTREAHLQLDGQEQPREEPFSSILGEIMYPGDPDAEPANVYNCRCTLTYKIVGFKRPSAAEQAGQEPQQAERQSEEDANKTEFQKQIAELQKEVEQNGVTTDTVMKAGEAMQKELNPIYEKAAADIRAKEGEYYRLREEYNKAWHEWRDEKNRKWDDRSLMGNDEYLKRVDKLEKAEHIAAQKKNAAYDAWVEAYNKVQYDNSSELLKSKLAEVRQMGSEGFDIKGHLHNSRSPVRKNVEYAYTKYPTSWVEKSVNSGGLDVKKAKRGYYSSWNAEIVLSGSGGNQTNGTAIHELGHRFEDVIPDIKKQEKAFYDRRTAGDSLEWLGDGYRKDEMTRKDNFISKYMGKEYNGDWYELCSMGFQYAYTEPLKLAADKDMQQWILGMLAIVP